MQTTNYIFASNILMLSKVLGSTYITQKLTLEKLAVKKLEHCQYSAE